MSTKVEPHQYTEAEIQQVLMWYTKIIKITLMIIWKKWGFIHAFIY
jgi:hypothetical protein